MIHGLGCGWHAFRRNRISNMTKRPIHQVFVRLRLDKTGVWH
jgi:hypothetical protein